MRLRLEFEGSNDAPGTLILKTGLPGRKGGQQEVAFYTNLASATPALVPRCFDASSPEDTHDWHLLLEDLSETHGVPTTWPLPPTRAQCERIMTARARFHAAWWDDPRLGTSIGKRHDDVTTAAFVRDRTAEFARFADLLGDRLSDERRQIYERFLDAAPRLFDRHQTHRNITLGHGDAHVWNVFLPKDGGDDVRLFDWNDWRIGLASSDLAYMMSTHWHPDLRRRLERPLLDHYHDALLTCGVRGYSRENLDNDYRLSALIQIIVPVAQAAVDIPPFVWWGHLERVMQAFDDLGCQALLG